MDAIVEVPIEGQRLILKRVQVVVERELGQLVELAKSGHDVLARLKAARAKFTELQREYEIFEAQLDRRIALGGTAPLPLLVADYCLRYPETSKILQNEYNLEGLVDTHLCERLKTIEQSILEGNTGPVLAWCVANKVALKRSTSALEYRVRRQHYLHLVASGDKYAAITYSRRHLSRYAQYGELGALALALVKPMKGGWIELASLFRQTFLDLYKKRDPYIMDLTVGGLAALKTRRCAFKSTSACPACSMRLATKVPYALHTVSCLDEDMVLLPSRRVTGYAGLRKASDGLGVHEPRVCDPETLEIHEEEDLERVFAS